jgi:predicted XRE-type DNA-binding protein
VVEDFDKNTYRAVYKIQLAAEAGKAGPRTANQGEGEVVKTKTRKKNNNSVTEGSGNVFADMGVAEPEQALAKAKLAAKIAVAIEEEELTQTQAAERLGTDQAKVSAIVRGRLDQFSTERLLQYAQMIGYDVEIRFSRRHAGAGHLRIGA